MHKQRYKIASSRVWDKRSILFFALLVAIMLCACLSSYLNIKDHYRIAIEVGVFIAADIICYYVFTHVYFGGIQQLIEKEGYTLVSSYSIKKYKSASAYTDAMKYIVFIVCLANIVVAAILLEHRMYFKTTMLVVQVIFFCVVIVYKAYFIDLIVAFSNENYISGLNLVEYINLDTISEVWRSNGYEDVVIGVELYHLGIKVGYDKFTNSDYVYLCKQIKGYKKQ